jgi:very-short-patch-repair endonuclease
VGPDGRLAALAADQHGVVHLAQARESGLSHDGVLRRQRAGRLLEVHPLVFRVAGAPDTHLAALRAAALAVEPGGVVSHRSAGWLWGLLPEDGEVVEVTVPRSRGPRLHGVVVHRSRDLVPEHTTVRQGIPVTNPLRTLVDLGAVCSRWTVEDALDRGLVARLFTVAAVEWLLHEVARPGRRGCGVLRTVLDERALGTARPDGLLEPRMARLLRSYGLPPAAFQHGVPEAAARLDFAYPDRRLGIEVDGYEVHGTARAMEADHDRHNRLVAAGWTVVRFTWHQVVRRPADVAAAVRSALGTQLGAQR